MNIRGQSPYKSFGMEEHFLKEFVLNQEREEPRPWYDPAGDCIIYQTSDEAIVAGRIPGIFIRSDLRKFSQ
jgi:hypothetical protein